MFSRFTAGGLVYHNHDRYPLIDWRIVEIGGADGLSFTRNADNPGINPKVEFTDTRLTHVRVTVSFLLEEGLDPDHTNDYVVNAVFIVPRDATIGVESDNPYPPKHGGTSEAKAWA
jgi:hypothetical protein